MNVQPLPQIAHHDIFQRLYYLPIILAAVWYGFRGGLFCSIIVSIAYAPNILFQWGGHLTMEMEKYLEILLYNVVGGVTGLLSQRERERTVELQKTARGLEESYQKLSQQSERIIVIEEQLRREPSHPLAPARAELLQTMRRFKLAAGHVAVEHPWKATSILAQAFRLGVPMTVHDGELVWSCRLDERLKYGQTQGFEAVVEHVLEPARGRSLRLEDAPRRLLVDVAVDGPPGGWRCQRNGAGERRRELGVAGSRGADSRA